MAAFLNHILTPDFALVFVAMLICLVGYGVPGWKERATSGLVWLLWLLGGLLCIIVGVKIAFGV